MVDQKRLIERIAEALHLETERVDDDLVEARFWATLLALPAPIRRFEQWRAERLATRRRHLHVLNERLSMPVDAAEMRPLLRKVLAALFTYWLFIPPIGFSPTHGLMVWKSPLPGFIAALRLAAMR